MEEQVDQKASPDGAMSEAIKESYEVTAEAENLEKVQEIRAERYDKKIQH